MLGRGALPQKALESMLKTAAFPQNLEKDVNLRFGKLSDAVVMQLAVILNWNLCQSWSSVHPHLLGVSGEGQVSSTRVPWCDQVGMSPAHKEKSKMPPSSGITPWQCLHHWVEQRGQGCQWGLK